MEDITKRLRSGARNAELTTLAGIEHDERCLEAADEIERLRLLIQNIETTWINGDCGEIEVDSAIARAAEAAKLASY